MSENRYVRLRCPVCDQTSPVCDQQADIRRKLLQRWWSTHVTAHLPTPIIERAEPARAAVLDGGDDGRKGYGPA